MSSGSATKSKKLTREDELLQQFSNNVTSKNSALFYGNAIIVSALPIWLFWRIQQLEILPNMILYCAVTALATYLMALAYGKVQLVLKHKLAQKREQAINREVAQEIGDRKVSRDERDERVLCKKNEVAQYEATNFSIFYNNALFLSLVVFFGFYLFRTYPPGFNYIISVAGSAGIVAFLSTGNK
ncbi:translocon-associated protein subunit gamma-like [Varroa jacobsoni]|uniref:Translocon-associated protein subunit gamma n=1 Tax=Varroa destructor TaxID=109461 RepID=A0A7M7JXP6_VARDE|nr:translocon-associated protein subunit gamma-like [Varroa destructor]XP_022698282.1 translocon-associated protein subunit gamma-like [Varroa jacobsoni]